MSKRKYKPYSTKKQKKNRRVRDVAMGLIVLIVALVIFNRTYKKADAPTQEETSDQTVALNEILPSEAAKTDKNDSGNNDSGPLTVLNPAVASAKPMTPTTPEPTPPSKPEVTIVPPVQKEPVETPPQHTITKPLPQKPSAPDTSGTDASSEQAKALVDEALKLRDTGKIIAARELLSDTLNEQLSPTMRSLVKFQLTKLAEDWLFSNEVMSGDKMTSYYQVQGGDLLQNIAKKYKVPYEMLMDINGISDPRSLQEGQTIKVIHGPFNVVVYKNNFTMDLYLQNRYVKTYRVGLGRAGHETPSGRWRVTSGGKLDNKPTWTDPDTGKVYQGNDPDYPLGSRWIALTGLEGNAKGRTGFAIHGTKDPESIGTRSSRGCIRLYNGEVIEVYNLLYGGISEVLIED